MNHKKFFYIVIILSFGGFCICTSRVLYINKEITNVILNNISDTLPDGCIFALDDSLLYNEFPQVQIKPQHISPTNTNFIHVPVLHYTPNDSLMGNYLIITTECLYDSLRMELKRYAEDVHTIYGYGIILEIVKNQSVISIKQLILDYNENLKGVFFVGNIGNCFFEVTDDFNMYGYRKWPCDLYFMDIDGNWIDEDENGIYDKHQGNVAPELFFGRLSTEGLPPSYGDEITLIRRQLDKSHKYWWRSSFFKCDTILNYVDSSWVNSFPSSTISVVFQNNQVDDIRCLIDSCFSHFDYLNRIADDDKYGFTYLAAHSSPSLHHFSTGYLYSNTIKNVNSSNVSYNLFCCSACNWTLNNNGYLGGAYLFNNGKTIAVVGSTKTGSMLGQSYFYNNLVNDNLGTALLKWWHSYNGSYHTNSKIFWHYGMTLLGDPTLNLRYKLSDVCQDSLSLTVFPSDNHSNLIMYKAGSLITVGNNFVIPQGVHVIFDAPNILFEKGFVCPIGSSFETRNEGCEL